jgi:hypothetical protein
MPVAAKLHYVNLHQVFSGRDREKRWAIDSGDGSLEAGLRELLSVPIRHYVRFDKPQRAIPPRWTQYQLDRAPF